MVYALARNVPRHGMFLALAKFMPRHGMFLALAITVPITTRWRDGCRVGTTCALARIVPTYRDIQCIEYLGMLVLRLP